MDAAKSAAPFNLIVRVNQISMKKLRQYKDNLNPSQIAEGMNVATKNAARLAEDADLLIKNNRFPSALALAILSIEESGKCSILREIATARNGNELKESWKRYRSHTSKNEMWIFPELVRSGGRKLSDFSVITDKNSEHPHLLDNLKQVSFYSDYLGNARWHLPEDAVDKDLAQSIVNIAKMMTRSKNHSTKEVELWIKHIKPVIDSGDIEMRKGLLAWLNEMKELDLIDEDVIKFNDFVDIPENSNN